MVSVSKNEKRDTMQWESIKTEVSSKEEEKKRLNQQARKVCMGEKVANLIKKKTIKVNPMHRHFTHEKSYIT